MYYFNCDYNEGAHPEILERLCQTNLEQTIGYGEDEYCAKAAELIRKCCAAPKAAVHFLVGGTQTNATVICAALRPHQGVLSANSGHINTHETGAVEASGHKVLPLPTELGKVNAAGIRSACELYRNDASFEHVVQPKMVYLSQPTEYGTLYTRKELEEISSVCREYGLYLFVDGARLGYGIASPGNDVTMEDLARLCDVFYIGGTKLGALFGEAVVIPNRALQEDFRCIVKQQGAMLAKGRLLGIQFLVLFEDGLYGRGAKHAIALAEKIRETLSNLHIPLLVENRTNQIFPVLPDCALEELQKEFSYCYQERVDAQHSAVRFCTSWATKPEAVDALCEALKRILAE